MLSVQLDPQMVSGAIPGWKFTTELRLQSGVWVVVQLHVFPDSQTEGQEANQSSRVRRISDAQVPPGGLTARDLRRIHLRTPARGALNGLYEAARRIAAQYDPGDRLHKSVERSGQIVRIASAYVKALRSGSKTPTALCARRLGMRPSKIRDAVHQARSLGFLTKSRGQGYAGGELTAKALVLVKALAADDRRRGKRANGPL
jgi:hypothetical protein